MPTPILLLSSSGKDSLASLARLQADPEWEVVGLVTSFNGEVGRVAMHGTRRELVREQAEVLGLPLTEVDLPENCPNDEYENRMAAALKPHRENGVLHVACGDLFLADIRQYREKQFKALDFRPIFPIWKFDTAELATYLIEHDWKLILTCVDTDQLDASFLGRDFDAAFLADLPEGVDPCGENGEFHTFVHACPLFSRPIPVTRGRTVTSHGGRFQYLDLVPEKSQRD